MSSAPTTGRQHGEVAPATSAPNNAAAGGSNGGTTPASGSQPGQSGQDPAPPRSNSANAPDNGSSSAASAPIPIPVPTPPARGMGDGFDAFTQEDIAAEFEEINRREDEKLRRGGGHQGGARHPQH